MGFPAPETRLSDLTSSPARVLPRVWLDDDDEPPRWLRSVVVSMNPRFVQVFPPEERVSPGNPKVSSVSLKKSVLVTSDSGDSDAVTGGIL